MKPKLIERWHKAASSADPALLEPLLADGAIFESPVVFRPQAGKALTLAYLSAAFRVLNNEHFRYLNEWFAERSAVLEFSTMIDGIEINGVDIIAWDEADRITHFKVMVRPLKAINLLHERMGAELQRAAAGGG